MEFKEAFLEKYPDSGVVLAHFEAGTGEKALWKNVTRKNLVVFVRYIKTIMAQSSARTYAAMVKSLLNDYKDEVELPKNFEEVLTVKNVKSINVFLNEADIKKFAGYAPKTKREKYAYCVFLLGCLTGARHSDLIKFTKGNIVESNLVYMSEKSNTKTFVPISPIVVRLINDLKDTESLNEGNYNSTVRKICKTVRINDNVKVFRAGKSLESEKWQFISSHTARRSFATNLYLLGADLFAISKMMGHADTGMTEGYICCGLREQNENVMSYFKSFE